MRRVRAPHLVGDRAGPAVARPRRGRPITGFGRSGNPHRRYVLNEKEVGK